MYLVPEAVRLALGIVAGISGTGLNVWIIAVIGLDWWKVGSLSSIDLILSSIGLVNAIQQLDITLDIIFSDFPCYRNFAGEAHLRFLNVLIGLVSSNFWSTVWLSTYYCFRIVNFKSKILFRLKMRIPSLIPKLLAMSITESIVITVPSFWNMDTPWQNVSCGQNIVVTVPYLVTSLTGTIVPLILTLIPTGLTLASLWRHTRRMKRNSPELSSSRTKAHITAVWTMVLLLTLHMAFCAVSVSIVLSSFNASNILQYFSWYFVYFYATMQAIVLINGNSKLKRVGQQMVTQISGSCAGFCQIQRM